MAYVLGIDASTTATKAVLIDDSGAVAGVASSEYGYDAPNPGWAEQSPDLWWDGALASIRDVLAATGTRGEVEQDRPRPVGLVHRVVAGEAEAHEVLRQQDVSDAGPDVRLVIADPDELRRGEPGERVVTRDPD